MVGQWMARAPLLCNAYVFQAVDRHLITAVGASILSQCNSFFLAQRAIIYHLYTCYYDTYFTALKSRP